MSIQSINGNNTAYYNYIIICNDNEYDMNVLKNYIIDYTEQYFAHNDHDIEAKIFLCDSERKLQESIAQIKKSVLENPERKFDVNVLAHGTVEGNLVIESNSDLYSSEPNEDKKEDSENYQKEKNPLELVKELFFTVDGKTYGPEIVGLRSCCVGALLCKDNDTENVIDTTRQKPRNEEVKNQLEKIAKDTYIIFFSGKNIIASHEGDTVRLLFHSNFLNRESKHIRAFELLSYASNRFSETLKIAYLGDKIFARKANSLKLHKDEELSQKIQQQQQRSSPYTYADFKELQTLVLKNRFEHTTKQYREIITSAYENKILSEKELQSLEQYNTAQQKELINYPINTFSDYIKHKLLRRPSHRDLILKSGFLNVPMYKNNNTFLMKALQSFESRGGEILDVFLNKEINVNLQNDAGETLLMLAVERSYYQIVEKLLQNPQTDITLKNDSGETAYDLVNDESILELFSEHYPTFCDKDQGNTDFYRKNSFSEDIECQQTDSEDDLNDMARKNLFLEPAQFDSESD